MENERGAAVCNEVMQGMIKIMINQVPSLDMTEGLRVITTVFYTMLLHLSQDKEYAIKILEGMKETMEKEE